MDYNHIVSLSAEELYQKALVYKSAEDYDNCNMYMVMAANYDHELAKEELHLIFANQLFDSNFLITKPFYEQTSSWSYSALWLGIMCPFETEKYRGVEFIKYAVEKGNIYAINSLGCLYYDGIGIEKDRIKAVELFSNAIQKGIATAYRNLGLHHYDLKEYSKALDLFTTAAAKGCWISFYTLGKTYRTGTGVYPDNKKAAELFSLGVEKGDEQCCNDLGVMYIHGLGVEKNKQVAMELFQKSAAKRNMFGMNNFAVALFENGRYHEAEKCLKEVIDKHETHFKQSTVDSQKNKAVDELCKMYKKTSSIFSKECVVNYFVRIGKIEKLKVIYDDVDIDRLTLYKKQLRVMFELQEDKTSYFWKLSTDIISVIAPYISSYGITLKELIEEKLTIL